LRVALIGAGMWAPRLAAACERAGLELVDAVEEADGVLIATPNDAHAENAIAAAGAERHVFVEKPIADTVEAAERIRDACVEAGVVLMVGHAFRRLGAARRAKELVGELGTVVLAEANFSLPGKLPPHAWRAQRARNPGGPIMQLGIHHVDTLAYLLGPIVRTTGRFARVHTGAEIDDVGVATLEFASGALGVVTGSYVSPHVFSLRVDEVSTLTLNGEPVEFEPRDMLAEELAEFGAAMRGDAVVETGADEGIAALRVVLEAVG
jgi:predicted dehydrogenase